jgi:hypothetical protein
VTPRKITSVAIAAVILSACGSDSGEPAPRQLGEFDACLFAKRIVEAQLVAPSTAKFSTCRPGTDTARYFDTAGEGSNIIRVTGTVDAQNPFGAMIRNSFTVDLVNNGTSFSVRDVVIEK